MTDGAVERKATEDARPISPVPGIGPGGGLYRVRYRVFPPFQSTGHSDLIRTLYKAFEEAALPIAMSGGKSPRPKAAFGPPLPTGCTSAGEYFDLDLERGVDDLVQRLTAALPAGLQAVSADRVDTRATAISSIIESAEYEFFIADEIMPAETVKRHLDLFSGERLWQVQRPTGKGATRTIDLKRAVLGFSHAPTEGGSAVKIRVKLNDPDGQTANPAIILSGLFRLSQEQAANVPVNRTEFFDTNGRLLSRMVWRRRRNKPLHSKSLEHLRHLDR